MRLLFLGDVVGRPGRKAVAAVVPRLLSKSGIDFVIANCENASGGKGVDPRSADSRIAQASSNVLSLRLIETEDYHGP